MEVIKLTKKNFEEVLKKSSQALKQGKVLIYPTDTSYGLAALAYNSRAINKIYKVKGRSFKAAVSVIAPSFKEAKKLVKWTPAVQRKFGKYLPGALTVVLPLRMKESHLLKLSANTGWLGIRMPKHDFALRLAEMAGGPITSTSANLSGDPDTYNLKDVIEKFRKQKYKPDLIIDAGILKKIKPSTVVKFDAGKTIVLREGPVVIK